MEPEVRPLSPEDMWRRYLTALENIDALEAKCDTLQVRVHELEDALDASRHDFRLVIDGLMRRAGPWA
jgi:hypothetical protein